MAETTVGSIKYDLDLDDSKFKEKVQGASKDVHGLAGAFEKAEGASKVFTAAILGAVAGLTALGFKAVAAYSQSEDVLAGLSAGLENYNKKQDTAGHFIQVTTGAIKESTKAIHEHISKLNLQKQVLDKNSSSYDAQKQSIDSQIISLKKQILATGNSTSTTRVWVEGIKAVKINVEKEVEALQKQASALQQVSKFSDEQILSADAMLTTFQLSTSAIRKLNPVLLDMAEGLRDVDGRTVGLDQAAKMMGKVMGNAEGGIEGMSQALRRNGVIMTDAQKKIFETGTELQRTNTLVEIMTFNFGGRALAAAKTYSGMMTILGNNVNDVMEIIGKGIVNAIRPMLVAFDKWFVSVGGANGVIKILKQHLQELQPYLPVIIGFIAGGLTPAIIAMTTAIVSAVIALSPFLAAGVAIGLVFMGLTKVYQENKALAFILGAAFASLATIIVAAFVPAIIGAIASSTALTGVMAILNITMLMNPAIALAAAIAALAVGIIYLTTQTDLLKTKQDMVAQAHRNVAQAAKEEWQAYFDLQNLSNQLEHSELRVEQAQIMVRQSTLGVSEATRIYGTDSLQADSARLQLKQSELELKDAVVDTTKKLDEYGVKDKEWKANMETSKAAQADLTKQVNLHATAWENLLGFIGGAISKLINWNSIANKIGAGIKLPGFADGVQNFGGGLALVGERGPELVNLPRGSDVIPNNKIGTGQNIYINVERIDSKMDIDMIGREIGFRIGVQPK